jgi:6-phosphofructokinase
MMPRMKVGILCGGGPAPGINSVIAAATCGRCTMTHRSG